MSVRIQYAYMKQQTWLYRRNYPKELQPVLGQAFKQSLKTGDARVAKARAEAEVVEVVTGTLRANINTTKHLMSDLGWTKCAVKWGGIDYARQLWVRPGYTVERGKIFGPDEFEEGLVRHLGQEVEIIR